MELVSIFPVHTFIINILKFNVGGNVINILREIGVYDEITKYLPETRNTSAVWFMCVMGNDIYEHIRTVSRTRLIAQRAFDTYFMSQLGSEENRSPATLLR